MTSNQLQPVTPGRSSEQTERKTSVREVTTYKEVPVIEDRIVHVPRVEIVTTQKYVPKVTTEIKETLVEVARVEVIQKDVEVLTVEEIVRRVPKVNRVEVQREKVVYKPKVEIKRIEREIEVDGELIEIEKEVPVFNHIVVPSYFDQREKTVVVQKMVPVLNESETLTEEVSSRQWEPEFIPVDVFVPKPVRRRPIPGTREERYEEVVVPPAQFNALVQAMNDGLPEADLKPLFMCNSDASFPMISGSTDYAPVPILGVPTRIRSSRSISQTEDINTTSLSTSQVA